MAVKLIHTILIAFAWTTQRCLASTVVHDPKQDVTFQGVCDHGIETFFSIPYGQDTSGEHRFKPPRPYIPTRDSAIDATQSGPACPQPYGAQALPLYLSNITDISEDCLHLNVYRAEGTASDAKLPVLVYIHGGSFFIGSKDELTIQPGGLILRSVDMGHPILVVNINYRLGVFGFAQSTALKSDRSENAGLRDQRLAIEWVKEHIAAFGGDPERITVGGQSSGGLAVGMQLLAYGATNPIPFQQASCESQALDLGITGNVTKNAMLAVTKISGCNETSIEAAETIDCLRNLTMNQLQHAQAATYSSAPASNIGDLWLPVVDGDFLPSAPSKLIAEGRFARNVTTMIGWCEGDGNVFVGKPTTEKAVHDFFRAYLPAMTESNLEHLLSLYPVSDFSPTRPSNLSVDEQYAAAQIYRAGRIQRDLLFTCPPLHLASAMTANVYLWDQNQTLLDPILASLGDPGAGVVHTSNFAYQFGNLSHYDVDGFPYHPRSEDFALRGRQSGSWAEFVATGRPSGKGEGTLEGWTPGSQEGKEGWEVFVIGGEFEGLFASSGPGSGLVFDRERLAERCGFINSKEVIEQLQY